jgi:signal transduction histidine kinase
MSPRRPRSRLLTKVLVAALLPAMAALALFGLLAHAVARRALEDELGQRLATAAAGIAMQILPEQLTSIGPGDEPSNTYANLCRRIEMAKERFGVRRVLLVARDLTGRGDTEHLVALGAAAHELGADRTEIERASTGALAGSLLFWGRDGRPYQRGYARVGHSPPAGFVVVEGSAQYFAQLASFRHWLLAGGALFSVFIAALATWLSRRISRPLARLARAAETIGRGDLTGPVAVETRDEIGYLAARLDEMRAALQTRDERMQMMLAGIAHEVRNPLGGLEIYAGLLREGLAEQPERLAEVARIEREIGYLKNVVSDFLEFARRPPPVMESLPVAALMDEVCEICRPAGSGPALRVEVMPDLVAEGDRCQLRRAVINLVRNAVTAAGPTGQVVLAARRNGSEIEWEVRDSGPGVPADIAEKVFTPFFTTREKGTGLGLAFVREITLDHGGSVVLDQAPEGGARFRFTTRGKPAA